MRKRIPSAILRSNPAAKDVNMTKEIKRRPRGAFPRGQFEHRKTSPMRTSMNDAMPSVARPKD